MSTNRLKTLLVVKGQVEDAAAAALKQAAGARARAEAEQAVLAGEAAAARAAALVQRAKTPQDSERASEAVGRARFAARLVSHADTCAQRLEAHRQTVLEPARRAEDEARKRHLAARQDREAIETRWEQLRVAESKREESKQEAEQDDRSPPRPGK